ncbi:putative transporter component [Halalkaliarchaeum sp. AArc-CO]|uniref:YeeE/YedE family protein n=1 Tax=unclassified Halalkaliarchaeum TaxID=2678344 RepID=UPI00217D3162|nr:MULTISPECIES: YeeE/YedE family protein [unclassified Halalkaliarchaeum]MDR5673848.1 YeeE/YedE family protein [Halalkaliarchaeum sp. AArc-GB]UWG50938.1 putative transporter component [Halalkaliarchaeum sp. AArc-CO]
MIESTVQLGELGIGLLGSELFPRGWEHYLLGGLLIGLGTVVIYAATAIPAGASTFLESTLSYASRLRRFQQPRFVGSRDWRVVFTLGIVAGAAGYSVVAGEFGWLTDVQPWRLFVGGILIGVGTRLGKGCTSGHGVCGVGSGSRTSILNVAVFMLVAIGVAQLVFAMGVRP